MYKREWSNHKYIRKEGNRYIYPEDLNKTSRSKQGKLVRTITDANGNKIKVRGTVATNNIASRSNHYDQASGERLTSAEYQARKQNANNNQISGQARVQKQITTSVPTNSKTTAKSSSSVSSSNSSKTAKEYLEESMANSSATAKEKEKEKKKKAASSKTGSLKSSVQRAATGSYGKSQNTYTYKHPTSTLSKLSKLPNAHKKKKNLRPGYTGKVRSKPTRQQTRGIDLKTHNRILASQKHAAAGSTVVNNLLRRISG